MTLASRATHRPTVGIRRVGYAAAIVVNALILYVVHNLLAWDLLPFLTADLELVLPLITVSLVAGMVANGIWIAFDPPWFRSATQIGLSVISLVVTIRMLDVFPFTFADGGFPWETTVRVLLVLVVAAIVIGTLAEGAKLIQAIGRKAA